MKRLIATVLVMLLLVQARQAASGALVGTSISGSNPSNAAGIYVASAEGTHTITASGADIMGVADSFFFVHEESAIDAAEFTLTVCLSSIEGTDPDQTWQKAGLMFRETLAENAQHIFATMTAGNGFDTQFRAFTGDETRQTGMTPMATPTWIRLEREGNVFRSFSSPDGAAWTLMAELEHPSPPDSAYYGMAVTSNDPSEKTTAVFENLELKVIEETLTWDGAGNGRWDTAIRWLGGPDDTIPDTNRRAIILDNMVTVAAPAEVYGLDIKSGGITIEAGQSLAVGFKGISAAAGTSVVLGSGATLSADGGTIHSLLTGGNTTLSNGMLLSVTHFDDQGLPGTFVKQGPGTLVLGEGPGATVAATATTFDIRQGHLQAFGDTPLGGAEAIVLAGGHLSLTGELTKANPSEPKQSRLESDTAPDALSLATTPIALLADSELTATGTGDYAALGPLTMISGTLSTTGQCPIHFASTWIDPAASRVGFDPQVATDYGVVDANNIANLTLVKAGPSTWVLDDSVTPTNLHMTAHWEVAAGTLVLTGTDPLGSRPIEVIGGTLSTTGMEGLESIPVTLAGGVLEIEGPNGLIDGLTERWFDGNMDDSHLDPIDRNGGLLTRLSDAVTLLVGPLHYDSYAMGRRHDNMVGAAGGEDPFDRDYFGAAWIGQLTIGEVGSGEPLEAGDITFGTASDDGSTLFIDINGDGDFGDAGEKIVDNNGLGGKRCRVGDVSLAAGTYQFAVGYYEETGSDTIEVHFGQGAIAVQPTTGAEHSAIFDTLTIINPSDPDQAGLWQTIGNIDVVLTDLDWRVTADSTLLIQTNAHVLLSPPQMQGGILTTAAFDGATIELQGVNIASDATRVGFDPQVWTTFGTIDAGNAPALTIVKSGSGDWLLDACPLNLAPTARWEVEDGRLFVAGTDTLGGRPIRVVADATSESHGTLQLAGDTSSLGGAPVELAGGTLMLQNLALVGGVADDLTESFFESPSQPQQATIVPLGPGQGFLGGAANSSLLVSQLYSQGGDFPLNVDQDGTVVDWHTRSGGLIPAGDPQHFGAVWHGTLTIAEVGQATGDRLEAGPITFATTSDDGSAIWIDGQLVVDNSDHQGLYQQAATILLGPGDHSIYIGWYEWGGDASMEAKFGQGANVPYNALTFIQPQAARQSGMWHSATTMLPFDTNGLDITVTDGGTIDATDLVLDTIRLRSGMLTTTGQGTATFEQVTIDAAATAVGFDTQITTRVHGTVVETTLPLVLTKSGPADLIFTTGSPTNVTIAPAEGRVVLAGTRSDAAVLFDNAIVGAGNGVLVAGAGGNGTTGVTVTVGSLPDRGVTVPVDTTLRLQSTDDYTLELAGAIDVEGELIVDGGTVILAGGGDIAKLDACGGTLRLGADVHADTMILSQGTIDTQANRVVIAKTLDYGGATYTIDVGSTFAVHGSDLLDEANLTLSGGTLTAQAANLDDATLAHWMLDSMAGDIVDDATGQNNGTIEGSPTWNPTGGMIGGALIFDGRDWVDGGDGIDINGKSFSLSVWAKRDTTTEGRDVLISQNPDPVNNQALHFGFRNADTFMFDFYGSTLDWTDAGNADTEAFHHWVGTYDAATEVRSLYRDGELVDTNNTAPFTGSGQFFLGYIAWGGELDDFLGAMDDVLVLNKALDQDEVTYLHQTGLIGGYGEVPIGKRRVNLIVTADTTLSSPTAAGAMFANLTIENNVTLALSNARFPVCAVDFTFATNSSVTGHVLVEGVLAAAKKVGSLNIAQDLEIGKNGTYAVSISTTDYDSVYSSGAIYIMLGGTLTLQADGNLAPEGQLWGDSVRSDMVILQSDDQDDGIVGDFATLPKAGDHIGYGVFLNAVPTVTHDGIGSMVLDVDLFQAAAGDVNGDHAVNPSDIMTILGKDTFPNRGPADWSTGDFNGDDLCNSSDIMLLLSTSIFPGTYTATMPEAFDGDPGVKLIVTADGVVIDTNGVAINGYILQSEAGILTGDDADNLGFFKEDTDSLIGGNYAFTLAGLHSLGDVVGELGDVNLLDDLTLTYTIEGVAGVYAANVVVPEPGTLALLASGLFGLFVMMRRRRRA